MLYKGFKIGEKVYFVTEKEVIQHGSLEAAAIAKKEAKEPKKEPKPTKKKPEKVIEEEMPDSEASPVDE